MGEETLQQTGNLSRAQADRLQPPRPWIKEVEEDGWMEKKKKEQISPEINQSIKVLVFLWFDFARLTRIQKKFTTWELETHWWNDAAFSRCAHGWINA